MEKNVTRRAFLRTAGIGAAASIVAACQPKIVEVTTVVEKVVKETVVEERVVKEAVEVEKEVTRVVERDVARPEARVSGDLIFWGARSAPHRPGGHRFCRAPSRDQLDLAPPRRPWSSHDSVHGGRQWLP